MLGPAIAGVKLGLPCHLPKSDGCWSPAVTAIGSAGGWYKGLCDTPGKGIGLFEYLKLLLDAVGIVWWFCGIQSSCGTIQDALSVLEPDSLTGLVASLLIALRLVPNNLAVSSHPRISLGRSFHCLSLPLGT
jgi:hypothetical protein